MPSRAESPARICRLPAGTGSPILRGARGSTAQGWRFGDGSRELLRWQRGPRGGVCEDPKAQPRGLTAGRAPCPGGGEALALSHAAAARSQPGVAAGTEPAAPAARRRAWPQAKRSRGCSLTRPQQGSASPPAPKHPGAAPGCSPAPSRFHPCPTPSLFSASLCHPAPRAFVHPSFGTTLGPLLPSQQFQPLVSASPGLKEEVSTASFPQKPVVAVPVHRSLRCVPAAPSRVADVRGQVCHRASLQPRGKCRRELSVSSKHAWGDQKRGSYELRTEICLGQLEQGKFCWDLPFQPGRTHHKQAAGPGPPAGSSSSSYPDQGGETTPLCKPPSSEMRPNYLKIWRQKGRGASLHQRCCLLAESKRVPVLPRRPDLSPLPYRCSWHRGRTGQPRTVPAAPLLSFSL